MTATTDTHRPLLAGLRIRAGRPAGTSTDFFAAGTLTGLATRSEDNQLVLVTNMHIVSSLMTRTDYRNPRGTEVMFQGLDDTTDKVGDSLRYYAVTTGKDNTADVATCDLVEGVTAEFAMHSGTDPHTQRVIIEGTAEPARTMELTMLGGVTGERTVTVDTTDESFTHRGMRFASMFRVNAGARAELGDSGAPLLLKVREGVYRMVGVAFARMRTKSAPRLGVPGVRGGIRNGHHVRREIGGPRRGRAERFHSQPVQRVGGRGRLFR